MIAAMLLGLRLSWPAAGAARLRTAMTLGAAAAGGLVMTGMLAVSHAEKVLHPGVYDDPNMRRLLVATVLAVALPVLVLLGVAAKLSAQLRERRLANLRLLGLSPARTRVVAVTEVAISALVGAVAGVAAFQLARPLIANLGVAGRSWTFSSLTPTPLGYLTVVVGVPLAVTVVASLPRRAERSGALDMARAATVTSPSRLRAAPLIVGCVICWYVVHAASGRTDTNSLIAPFFAGVGLLGIGLVLLVPALVRLVADGLLALSQRPTLVIAGRRLQAQPAGVNRVISGLLIGLFLVTGARGVVVAFESTPQYLSAAAQVEDQQTATAQTSARKAAPTLQRALAVPGVTGAAVFPELEAMCKPTAFCPVAIVASCAQLRSVAPDLAGCSDKHPMWASARSVFGTNSFPAATEAARAAHRWTTYSSPGRGADKPPAIDLPAPSSRLSGADGAVGSIGASVIIPPTLPGIRSLAEASSVIVFVTGDPGRGLSDSLRSAGVPVYSGGDFADYDLTLQLRALVWAVATVIVSMGLLAFAIGAIDRAVARRREVVSLQLVGVGKTVLRTTQLVEAAVPLVLGCLLAIGCGVLAGETYLSLGGPGSGVPWGAALGLAAIAAAGSIAVAGLTVVASSPRIRPELIRSE